MKTVIELAREAGIAVDLSASGDTKHYRFAGFEQAFERLVELVRDERNALAEQPAQQEPVAWYKDEDGIRIYYESKVWDDATPLYTSPPAQRTWVRLTDEEIEKGRDQTFSTNNPYCPCDSKTMLKAARWAEAKSKEKNA